MRYILFGTPGIARTVLTTLCEQGRPPIALVTNPDRPVGRKHIVTAPPTKEYLRTFDPHLPILQFERLDDAAQDELRRLRPDFGIVVAYAKIIPEHILGLFPKGVIGVHPSLLPKLRGASPIMSAILDGVPRTGVTLYLMDAHMDQGPILAQESLADYDPDAETADVLTEKLAREAGMLLLSVLPQFEAGQIVPKPQNEAEATFTKKFTTQDAYIAPEDLAAAARGADPKLAVRLDRVIRALNPEPGAWTMERGKRVKLLHAKLLGGRLTVTELQYEGKKPQKA